MLNWIKRWWFQQVLDDEPAYTDVGFTYPTIFAEFSNRILDLPVEKKEARACRK